MLLAAGSGEQLECEVEQSVRHVDPARLVVVVPRTKGQYADFRESVGDLFPKGLPEAPKVRSSRIRYVRAVVWFDADWTPHLEPLRGRLPLLRFAARTQRALPRALGPVYERAGLQPLIKNRTTRPRPSAVTASVALFSTFWLGLEGWFLSLFFALPLAGAGLLDLIGVGTSVASADRVGTNDIVHIGDLVFGVVFVTLLWSAPLVLWMSRVLRAGPIAIQMLQILGLSSGVGIVAVAISLAFFNTGLAAVIGVLVGPFLFSCAVLLFLPALLLQRRGVRDWVDSRT